MSHKNHRYVVVLAGGSGTRLWPYSRQATPKQFLKVVGQKTMLQLTAERALKLVDWDHLIIITNHAHAALVKKQLPKVNPDHILLEPQGKNTAIAMLIGSLYAKSLDEEAIIINSASDHYVSNSDFGEFTKVMKQACDIAATNQYLITVGIPPTYPETGFGYIKVGEQLPSKTNEIPIFKVERFTEKPNSTTAAAFIATGKYFWNANMYVWSSKTIIDTFKKYAPEIYQPASILTKVPSSKFQSHFPQIYQAVPDISIDYAISEKTNNLLLIPGNFSWTDVGDWRVAYDLAKNETDLNVHKDETGNNAELVTYQSQQNYVSSLQKRLVALVGIKDLVIVDTPDILLITKRDQAQNVKKIVEELKAKKRQEYL
jgi:mannose-1-phosphate guanylyltransferase